MTKEEKQKTHDRVLQECWSFGWNYLLKIEPGIMPLIWHVKNETRPFATESEHSFFKRLTLDKSIGVVPGVFDLHWYRGVLHIFEIKLAGDELSPMQEKFAKSVQLQGGTAHVVENSKIFQNIFLALLHEKK